MTSVLDIQDLSVRIETPRGVAGILHDLFLTLSHGERLGIVGESGSGKSMLALAIMGLLPEPASASGRILFKDDDLLAMSDSALCGVRGRHIAMVFQEPMTALNPVRTIGDQIAEGPRLHLGMNRREAGDRARQLLDKVGLPRDEVSPALYPHQLSGGQRQRVVIAIALACEPRLLIADEPTTALDVTSQIGILDLIASLVDETSMALIMISHDLGVIARTTSRMAVMYAGRIVERGETGHLMNRTAHPYTQGLLEAMPQHAVLSRAPASKRPRLPTIPGVVPRPHETIKGCAFAPRCAHAARDCQTATPALRDITSGHQVACYHPIGTSLLEGSVH